MVVSHPIGGIQRAVASVVRRVRPRYARRRKRIAGMSTQEVFTDIFKQHHWGEGISVSGKGSIPESTRMLASQLPELVEKLGVKVLFDGPCGDFSWMKSIPLGIERYIGADIVEPLIKHLQETEAGPGREFRHMDLLRDDLPACDMIFCRDCMLHLSYGDQRLLLENFLRSEFSHIVLSTYPDADKNRDIVTGEARPVNLMLPPFNLPEPILLLNDEGESNHNRCMGVWSREQLGR